jgi:hypothetical protein
MTEYELLELERAVQYDGARRPVVAALASALREAWAERDWLVNHLVRDNCPSVKKWDECKVNYDDSPEVCAECWLKAAKEALGD